MNGEVTACMCSPTSAPKNRIRYPTDDRDPKISRAIIEPPSKVARLEGRGMRVDQDRSQPELQTTANTGGHR
jgi:hypothetical protein